VSVEPPEQEPFTVESIVTEAGRRTGGLDDLGQGPFLEPLALFLESPEREARLNEVGRLIARERALGHTVNRLGYVRVLAAIRTRQFWIITHPGERPVFEARVNDILASYPA
jgi:hypothetical protein